MSRIQSNSPQIADGQLEKGGASGDFRIVGHQVGKAPHSALEPCIGIRRVVGCVLAAVVSADNAEATPRLVDCHTAAEFTTGASDYHNPIIHLRLHMFDQALPPPSFCLEKSW